MNRARQPVVVVVDDLLCGHGDGAGLATSTRGTLLHGTKLPVTKWRRAAELVLSGERVCIREIEMACGVSYKTAWRIRRVLVDAAQSLSEARQRTGARPCGSGRSAPRGK